MKNLNLFIIGVLISLSINSCKTDVEKKSENQIVISGKIVTKGAQTPLEGVGVFLGTYGHFVGGSIFDKTLTDKDGNFQLIMEKSQIGCHLMLEGSTELNLIKITDETGQVAESEITNFENQTRDVLVQAPTNVQVRISNLSEKYERIQGVLGHHPHKNVFFSIEKGETQTMPIWVWGDDLDSFNLSCALIDQYGQAVEHKEVIKVNVPMNKSFLVARSF